MQQSRKLRNIHSTFVKQHSRFYCGLACLASVIRYHGGSAEQEKLQAISGTTLNGTSLLGLYQAAKKSGFDAGGYEATIESLKGLNVPVILHTITSEGFEHFVVCYGFNKGKFIIGDPAQGVVYITGQELDAIWKSKALLKLTPCKGFTTQTSEKQQKRAWFMQLIKPDLSVLGAAVFMGVIISALSLATAIFTQKLIDRFIPEKDLKNLALGLILFALVLVARAVLGHIRTLFLVRQGKDMNIRLISDFFGKLLYLPKPFFDSTTTGDMVARMNDAQRIQRVVVNLSSQVTIDLLIVITSVVYIFFLSVSSGIISLLAIPVFGAIAWLFNKQVIHSQQQVMQAYAATESRYIDTIQGIKALKSFNREALFSKIVNLVYSLFMQRVYQLGKVSARLNLHISLASSLWLVVIISWAAWQVFNEQLLLGQMMAIVTIAGSLVASVVGISMANIQFHEARIAFNRMYEFSSSNPEYETGGDAATNITDEGDGFRLTVSGLNFRFPGKRLLFHNINLDLEKGRIAAIFGEVGCGKSTLLDILLRFHQIENGTLTLNGKDWETVPTEEWRKRTVLVPQHVTLFNATILENIALEEEVNPQEIVAFCQEYGFHGFIMELQQGYATMVNENSSNLSGGQRHLIALAWALYKKPGLLLLDEATAAMDRRTEKFVVNLIKKLKHEMAVLIVTHRPQLASLADTIYVIENNSISISGNPSHVYQNNLLFRESFAEMPVFQTSD